MWHISWFCKARLSKTCFCAILLYHFEKRLSSSLFRHYEPPSAQDTNSMHWKRSELPILEMNDFFWWEPIQRYQNTILHDVTKLRLVLRKIMVGKRQTASGYVHLSASHSSLCETSSESPASVAVTANGTKVYTQCMNGAEYKIHHALKILTFLM